MEKTYKTDIVVIGAGPVGLFSVFACGMLGMKCHVVDSLEHIGGQCTALYPEKPIYDIPGHPQISAAELVAQLERQATPFSPVYHLNQTATDVRRDDTGFRVETTLGTDISCKAVILAAGAGAFGPNRPPIEGLEAFEGKSVFYMVRRKSDFAGKRIVIAGGGDSAVDWAISLADTAAKIFFVHRRDKFRAAPDSVEKLKALAAAGRIEMVIPFQLHALSGADGRLAAVDVADMDGNIRRLEADVLLPFFGIVPQTDMISAWGVRLENHHTPVDPSTMSTSVPGIFAAGDISAYPRKLKLILTGFAEATQAAHAARHLVFPDEELHFVYSTTKGLPHVH